MDKKIRNRDISSRHKRRLAQKETEIDYFLLESSSSGVTDFGSLGECIKKCRIENDQSSSVSTSSSPSNGQLPNFSDNNNEEEYSDEVHNTEVVTDDEDFIDIEEREEMQPLSLDSDDSSDNAGDNMNIDDKSMDNVLLCNLRNWSFEYKIRHNAINALMEILRHALHSQFKTLPKNARVLLKTPKQPAEIVALAGGSYYHFGLSNTLEVFLQHYKSMSLKVSEINLLINIDGLPISRSSPSSFWPILLSDDISNQVHIVGLFYGRKKPNNANEYLQPFVKELIPLVQRGYHSDLLNCNIKVNVKAIICDAPAQNLSF